MQDKENISISKSSEQLISDLLAHGRAIEAISEMEDDLNSAILKYGSEKPYIIKRHSHLTVFIDIANHFDEAIKREQILNKELNRRDREINALKNIIHGINKRDSNPMINFIDGLVKTRKPGKEANIED